MSLKQLSEEKGRGLQGAGATPGPGGGAPFSGLPQKDAGCRENASLWAYLSMCAWDRGLLQALARTEEVKCSPE